MSTTEVIHTATIVSAYLRNHTVMSDEIPALITSVHSALGQIGNPVALALPVRLIPAVPVRKSVRPDTIVCLDCGYSGQMLRRHLTTAHGLSVPDYRAKWGLGPDYPVVAPDYAVRRSVLAKKIGLGQRGAHRR